MKFGLHKMTWGKYFDTGRLDLMFAQTRAAGGEALELRPPDEVLNGDMDRAQRVRKMADSEGIELKFCFGYPRGLDMRLEDSFTRKYALMHLNSAIRAAAALGGTEIGGVLYSTWPSRYDHDMLTREIRQERVKRSIECIRAAMPAAEEYGVRLNMEILNRYENYIINTVDEGIRFCEAVDSKCCGLLLDIYHMNIEEADITAAIRRASPYLGKFHVSEPDRNIPYHDTRINWKEIGEALKETGFDGAVIMEAVVGFDGPASYSMRLWRDGLKEDSLDARLEAMKRGLSYIRSQFGQ
ncbi:sugar phosphate isomerase/epimerase family protein [Anaerolentibacter hominis]|uniref:sugar phosphate isomerase/epimerase family protein n=1 Tax=Anaerolentibacter hominis TaxID=3079009 RepID=UPI0031B8750F